MQVFDENGKFLTMWPTGYNSAVLAHTVTQDDFVWVADWTTDRLVKYDLDGHYILDIGGHGALAGSVRWRPPDPRRFGAEPVRDRGRRTIGRRCSGPSRMPTRTGSSGRWRS